MERAMKKGRTALDDKSDTGSYLYAKPSTCWRPADNNTQYLHEEESPAVIFLFPQYYLSVKSLHCVG